MCNHWLSPVQKQAASVDVRNVLLCVIMCRTYMSILCADMHGSTLYWRQQQYAYLFQSSPAEESSPAATAQRALTSQQCQCSSACTSAYSTGGSCLHFPHPLHCTQLHSRAACFSALQVYMASQSSCMTTHAAYPVTCIAQHDGEDAVEFMLGAQGMCTDVVPCLYALSICT